VELSLSPVFRRAWSSLYAGLRSSRPQRQKLMKLYIEQMPTGRPVLVGDHTAWSRREAVTLKTAPSTDADSRNKPIAVGHGFSTLAWIPETRELGITAGMSG